MMDEAERERLRAAGLNDDDIAAVLARREGAPTPAPPDARSAPPTTITPDPRRKALLIASASVLLLVALTAFHIPQWAYSEIQASIAQNTAMTQDVGPGPIYDDYGRSWYSFGPRPTGNTPLTDDEQKERVKKLIEFMATAEDGGPCDINITPLYSYEGSPTEMLHESHPRDNRRHCILPYGLHEDHFPHWERPSPSDPDTKTFNEGPSVL